VTITEPFYFSACEVTAGQYRAVMEGRGAVAAGEADLVPATSLTWLDFDTDTGEPAVNPTGPRSGNQRVVRGGSFRDPGEGTRSAARRSLSATATQDDVGFRVARSARTR
jgi:formylglycine-generating enzyme required for sulfatase activity